MRSINRAGLTALTRANRLLGEIPKGERSERDEGAYQAVGEVLNIQYHLRNISRRLEECSLEELRQVWEFISNMEEE